VFGHSTLMRADLVSKQHRLRYRPVSEGNRQIVISDSVKEKNGWKCPDDPENRLSGVLARLSFCDFLGTD
jgi:hypothetical protein